MVRSRTPKITLHVDEAKCILYDTSPDFEALFYQGTKFHISKEGHIKISNTDGTSLMLDSNSRSTCLSPDIQEMLEKSHKVCKFIILIWIEYFFMSNLLFSGTNIVWKRRRSARSVRRFTETLCSFRWPSGVELNRPKCPTVWHRHHSAKRHPPPPPTRPTSTPSTQTALAST